MQIHAMYYLHKALKTSHSILSDPNFLLKTIYGNYSKNCHRRISQNTNFQHFLTYTPSQRSFLIDLLIVSPLRWD